MSFVLACIYFYLPAAFANMGASFSRFIPFFKSVRIPVDFGKLINGKRIVGDHKTLGGFSFGVILGTTVGVLKYLFLDRYFPDYQFLHLSFPGNLLFSFLMAFMALTGDIVKSIFKRVFNIAPHKAWVPFDEIDHSTLSMAMAVLVFGVSFRVMLTVIFVFFFLHLIANVVGYLLKIKSVPY